MNKKIIEVLGFPGRMISASKGRYSFNNPDNIVIFNANIFNSKKEKVWYGDLDLSTKDIDNINKLAIELKTTLYVLREMDGRFTHEDNPKLDNVIYTTDGTTQNFCNNFKITTIANRYYHKKIEKLKQAVLPKHADKDYKEEEFTVKIKIEPTKYASDPLNKLFNFIEKKLKSLDYSKKDFEKMSLYYTKGTEKELLKIIEQFLIKKHKLKKGSYDFEKTLSWVVFDLPMCFIGSLQGPVWAKKNHIYITFNLVKKSPAFRRG